MPQTIKVADVKSIGSGTSIRVEAAGQKIALFNIDGVFYAISDTCTHRGGPLSEGTINGVQVTCPWHGAKFDLKSGNAVGPPAKQGVPCYKVIIDGEEIKLELP